MTVISDALIPVLARALADAIAFRTPHGGDCPDCPESFEGRCAVHAADQDLADSYRGAALVLGVRFGT